MAKTKVYKLSIPKKYEDKIAQLAREQNMKPTRFLTSIIEDALNIETRTVGNPDIATLNTSKLMQCGWCGHQQEVRNWDSECRNCGECEFKDIN